MRDWNRPAFEPVNDHQGNEREGLSEGVRRLLKLLADAALREALRPGELDRDADDVGGAS